MSNLRPQLQLLKTVAKFHRGSGKVPPMISFLEGERVAVTGDGVIGYVLKWEEFYLNSKYFSASSQLTNIMKHAETAPELRIKEFGYGEAVLTNRNVGEVEYIELLHSSGRTTCIQAEYAYLFHRNPTRLSFRGYAGMYDPVFVYQNNELIGFIMPVKVRKEL